MKQTAVEWLVEQFNSEEFIYRDRTNIIQQAKEMERQQIVEAWNDGAFGGGQFTTTYENSKQYYNEQFKNK